MRRVSVVGTSGSGKSTLARHLAKRLDTEFVELDSIHHLQGWTAIDPDELDRIVGEITGADDWVIDGNYSSVVSNGVVWERADTVVWLDPPQASRDAPGRRSNPEASGDATRAVERQS